MLSSDNGIMSVAGYQDILSSNFTQFANKDLTNMNSIIDVLNVFSTDNWNKLIELFPAQAELITNNLNEFNHMNSFLTINMSQNPGLTLGSNSDTYTCRCYTVSQCKNDADTESGNRQ